MRHRASLRVLATALFLALTLFLAGAQASTAAELGSSTTVGPFSSPLASTSDASGVVTEPASPPAPLPEGPLDPPRPPPLPGPIGPGPVIPSPPIIKPIERPPSAFPEKDPPAGHTGWPPPDPPVYNEIPEMWFNVTPAKAAVGDDIDVEFTLVGMNATSITMYYKPFGKATYYSIELEQTTQSYIWGVNWPYGFYYRSVQTWEGTVPAQYESGLMPCYWRCENDEKVVTFPDEWAFPFYMNIVDMKPPVVTHAPPAEMNLGEETPIWVNATDDVGVRHVILWWRTAGQLNETRIVLEMQSGTRKDGSWNFTFPAPTNLTWVYYRVMVTDGYNKVYFPATGSYSIRVEDPTPPVIEHDPPLSASVLYATELSMRVSDNVVVAGVEVYFRVKGELRFKLVKARLAEGTVVNGTYALQIPRIEQPGVLQYYILARGLGESSVLPVAPGLFEVDVEDAVAPMILHRPLDGVLVNASFAIEAFIYDDIGVTEAYLLYRIPGDDVWQRMGMRLDTYDASRGTWVADFAGIPQNGTLEYYIEAGDGSQTATTEHFALPVIAPPTPYERQHVDEFEAAEDEFPWNLLILTLMVVAGMAVVLYELVKKAGQRNARKRRRATNRR